MRATPDKNPELYDLSTVAVSVFSDAPETLRQRANIQAAGAIDVSDLSPEGVQEIAQQKIAVIFDEETKRETLEKRVVQFEKFIETHPEISVRFFFLHWTQAQIPDVFHIGERFECLNIDKIGAQEIPAYLNKILYKARLPLFLRQGYEVEISETLEEIEGTLFRPIIIHSSVYVTEGLYIHNKRLYRKKSDGKMDEITGEKYPILMKRSGSKLSGSLPVDTLKTEE